MQTMALHMEGSWLELLPAPFISDLVSQLACSALAAVARSGRAGRQLACQHASEFECDTSQPHSRSMLLRVLRERGPAPELKLHLIVQVEDPALLQETLTAIEQLPAACRQCVQHVQVTEVWPVLVTNGPADVILGSYSKAAAADAKAGTRSRAMALLGPAFPALKAVVIEATAQPSRFQGHCESRPCHALFTGLAACSCLTSVTLLAWDFAQLWQLPATDIPVQELPSLLPHVRELRVLNNKHLCNYMKGTATHIVHTFVAAMGRQVTQLEFCDCPPLPTLSTFTLLQRVTLAREGGLSEQLLDALLSLPALTHVTILCGEDERVNDGSGPSWRPVDELGVSRVSALCAWEELHLSFVSLPVLQLLPAGIQQVSFEGLHIDLALDPAAAADACHAARLERCLWKLRRHGRMLNLSLAAGIAADGQQAGALMDGVLGAVAPLLQPVFARTHMGLYMQKMLDVNARDTHPKPHAGAATARHLQALLRADEEPSVSLHSCTKQQGLQWVWMWVGVGLIA